jgi:tRNA 2-thiouridine synthesizing protein A
MLKKYLNANDLNCPLPLLKTKLSLSELNSGEILEITATDPTSWEDFTSYAKISGNKLIHAEKKDEKFVYRIEKK